VERLLTELKELAQKPIKGIDKVKLQAKINDLEKRLSEQRQITTANPNKLP
jgi:hypothetical protein